MTFSSPHHSFDINLAAEYSIEEAILIHHFQHWILVNYRQGMEQKEGLYWTYQTVEWMAAHFTYWSSDQIHRIIKKLVEKRILKKGDFNKKGFDHTIWYALIDQSFLKPEIDVAKSPNRCGEIANAIPDTKEIFLKEDVDKKEIEKKEMGGTPKPPIPIKETQMEIEREEYVSTTESEHDKLVKEYGLETTLALYKRLSDWRKDASPKDRKKNTMRCIQGWVILAEAKYQQEIKKWKPENLKSQTTSINSKENLSVGDSPGPILPTPEQRLKILNK